FSSNREDPFFIETFETEFYYRDTELFGWDNPKRQRCVAISLHLEVPRLGHAKTRHVRAQRMGIAARDECDANVVFAGEIAFLRFVQTAQQSGAAIIAADAYRSVDITFECAQRPAFEIQSVIAAEHLGDHRRAGLEFLPKRTEKSRDLIFDHGDHRAKVLRDASGLRGAELRR